MKKQVSGGYRRWFNSHTGAAFGLVTGIILGSLLLDFLGPAIAAHRITTELRQLLTTTTPAAPPSAGRASSPTGF
jgi:hypothetical protein